ncbi:helix-turn-helix transcriptional regulator [Streptomyces monashensis]|uniref:helix-turn-helix domain-containing protein n=1 Tax=Streptomyces monashensis TaxID=1678012 RepID=UPI00340F0CAF
MSERPRGPLGAAGNNVRRNIRRLREQRHWSYRDVEERLARAGRAIPAVEQGWIDAGERRVDVDDLVALAAVFELSPEQLLEAPAECQTCHGAPPPGFLCIECETTALPTHGA